MHPTLKCLEAELTGSLTGLTPAALGETASGEPGKWCIQQIVCHLLLSYQTTIDIFEARIAKGTPTRTKPTLWQRLGQVYIIKLGRFPQGRKAPAAVDPSRQFPLYSVEDLIDRIQMELARFDAVADRAAELFGNVPAISHIVLGPMPVDSWRTFHLIHGRHHIDQILALRKPQRVRKSVVSEGIFAAGRSKASDSL